MMTPRSVNMGNKVYKLHVKYGSNRETLSVSPDTSIKQLKDKIHQIFKVDPDSQKLLINGKLPAQDENLTLKQALIPNGSKILLQNVNNLNQQTSNLGRLAEDYGDAGEPPVPGDVNGMYARELSSLRELDLKASELHATVKSIEAEVALIEQNLNAGASGEVSRLRKESGGLGEKLMKLLETLDQLIFPQEMVDARADRKRVANTLNRVLDANDANLEKLESLLKKSRL